MSALAEAPVRLTPHERLEALFAERPDFNGDLFLRGGIFLSVGEEVDDHLLQPRAIRQRVPGGPLIAGPRRAMNLWEGQDSNLQPSDHPLRASPTLWPIELPSRLLRAAATSGTTAVVPGIRVPSQSR